jgi:hypothetical protein
MFHMHIQNDMDRALRGLNLHLVWEELEPGQVDVVDLEPGASIEIQCNDPNQHLFSERFRAAVEAAGGMVWDVWFCPVSELPPPPQE